MSRVLAPHDVEGWELTGRTVWAVGGAGIEGLAGALAAVGARMIVSPPFETGTWAHPGSYPGGPLDGLVLMVEEPRHDIWGIGSRHVDPATAVTDWLGIIFSVIRTAAGHMRPSGGAIVIVVPQSRVGGLALGSVSEGLQTLGRSLAIALGSAGITVNLVSVGLPGFQGRSGGIPRGVVGAVTYLLSCDTAYLTGQQLCVDAAPREGAE